MSEQPLLSAAQQNDLLRDTFVEQVDQHFELPSTSDRALELALRNKGSRPLLVLTRRQLSGRGRNTNRWWAADGALTFSLLLGTDSFRLPTSRLSQVSLSVGLAVCETLANLRSNWQAGLKWPNDVHLNRRKVCGILVEVAPQRPPSDGNPVMVIGIGINVNNSLESGPLELRQTATAMTDEAGQRFDLVDVLTRVLQQLADELSQLSERQGPPTERWQNYCVLTGRQVRIANGLNVTAGVCLGIDGDGGLLVRDSHTTFTCYSGTVSLR